MPAIHFIVEEMPLKEVLNYWSCHNFLTGDTGYTMGSTKYWIALDQAQGIGPVHMSEIYHELDRINLSISDLFDLTGEEIKEEFPFHDKVVDGILAARGLIEDIEKDYFSLLDAGIEIIPFFSGEYPAYLKETMGKNVPPILYTFGNKTILQQKGIAILGDRDVSEKGEMIAYMGAKDLARHDIVTISGFASGVGMIAHRAALQNGGMTTAVLPCGMLNLHIPELIKEVLNPDAMVLVSPFYPNAEANKYNAYNRNKIICGLSKAAYIVEAPEDGGIFEAAKSAKKLNIPLFTTMYGEYPDNAKGNEKIMKELGGRPVQRRRDQEQLAPNMDELIACAKF